MLTIVTLIVITLPAIAAHRALNQGEADALYAIWGVRSMHALREIEENPQKFWQDTEHKLFKGEEKLITHLAFCKWFTPIVKNRLTQKLKSSKLQPWFAGNAIEDLLKEFFEEGSENFDYALAIHYAYALDCTLIHLTGEVPDNPDSYTADESEFFLTRKRVQHRLQVDQQGNFTHTVPRSHKTLRWQKTPDGRFSFFDSLVTQSKGFQLCAISSNPEDWERFSAHNALFQLYSGILEHDAFVHAGNVIRFTSCLQTHGISAQDQFNAACNPDALAKGNLITMSHQVQAWFTQFHEGLFEEPSCIGWHFF